MQTDIQNDRALRDCFDKFGAELAELRKKGLMRPAVAAMALAIQSELTRYDNRGAVEHSNALELIMRGVYSALTNDGQKSHHAAQKLSLGYIQLMCDYHEDKRPEIVKAFRALEELLR